MINSYVAAEVVEIGNGKDIIHGETKGVLFDDCPNQEKRNLVIED